MATALQDFDTPAPTSIRKALPAEFETFGEQVEKQVVMRFASVAARDATVTSPEEGMVVVTLDTTTVWLYNGSAWVSIYVPSTTYSPTLTGMVVGTGGTNTATYTVSGNTLTIDGTVTFGSSGQTFPTAPTIALPSGFTLASNSTIRPYGWAFFSDNSTAANNRLGSIFAASTTTLAPIRDGFSATTATLSTSAPFTWAQSDSIVWHAVLQGSF